MSSTFIAHCIMKIKSHFKDVDQLIAKVKSATAKNKTKQAKFVVILVPRFSLLFQDGEAVENAALYCAKDLPEPKAIVESFEGSCSLVTQAKVSMRTTRLATQLLKIKNQRGCLVELYRNYEKCQLFTINETVSNPRTCFQRITRSINRYIQKRMQN